MNRDTVFRTPYIEDSQQSQSNGQRGVPVLQGREGQRRQLSAQHKRETGQDKGVTISLLTSTRTKLELCFGIDGEPLFGAFAWENERKADVESHAIGGQARICRDDVMASRKKRALGHTRRTSYHISCPRFEDCSSIAFA